MSGFPNGQLKRHQVSSLSLDNAVQDYTIIDKGQLDVALFCSKKFNLESFVEKYKDKTKRDALKYF